MKRKQRARSRGFRQDLAVLDLRKRRRVLPQAERAVRKLNREIEKLELQQQARLFNKLRREKRLVPKALKLFAKSLENRSAALGGKPVRGKCERRGVSR